MLFSLHLCCTGSFLHCIDHHLNSAFRQIRLPGKLAEIWRSVPGIEHKKEKLDNRAYHVHASKDTVCGHPRLLGRTELLPNSIHAPAHHAYIHRYRLNQAL